MKIIWCFLVFFLILTESSSKAQKTIQFIEAESGRYESMQLLKNKNASGKKFLQMIDNGKVTWSISVPDEGYYNIELQYRSLSGDNEQLLQINGKTIHVGFGISREWKIWSQPFRLNTGANEIVLKKSWGNMDVDFIAIKSADISPEITPLNLTFYKHYPNNQTLKIDNYHQNINQILINNQPVAFTLHPYPYQDCAVWAGIKAEELSSLPYGLHPLTILFDSSVLTATIKIDSAPAAAGLILIAPDVSHGSSVILRLPEGKNMLIDCGQGWIRDSVLIPLLQRHQIDTIHTFMITHYHDDHAGGDSGKTIINRFHVEKIIDYNTYPTGHVWEENGVAFKILNSYTDGDDENTRSLAIKIAYKEFVYIHSGDIYAINQQKIRETFPDDIKADVFYANHHFHGSADTGYLRAVNPDLVIVQAQQAIYARNAYMVDFKKHVADFLNNTRVKPIETLPVLETGMVVIRVQNGKKWWHETYKNQDTVVIPGFGQ